jgi:23S rRNA (uridine2552-2'-O)-methyltransferase
VEILQGDFTEEPTLGRLLGALGGQPVDLVISDIAPNISGVDSADQGRAMYLAELALDFSGQVLKPGGAFLVKVFQGRGFNEFFKALKQQFARVVSRKPKASRPRSPEIYLLATGFRGGGTPGSG